MTSLLTFRDSGTQSVGNAGFPEKSCFLSVPFTIPRFLHKWSIHNELQSKHGSFGVKGVGILYRMGFAPPLSPVSVLIYNMLNCKQLVSFPKAGPSVGTEMANR
jgi:hypothetical protein